MEKLIHSFYFFDLYFQEIIEEVLVIYITIIIIIFTQYHGFWKDQSVRRKYKLPNGVKNLMHIYGIVQENAMEGLKPLKKLKQTTSSPLRSGSGE